MESFKLTYKGGLEDSELKPGSAYIVNKQPMTSKVFDGQDYKPDTRIMFWVNNN